MRVLKAEFRKDGEIYEVFCLDIGQSFEDYEHVLFESLSDYVGSKFNMGHFHKITNESIEPKLANEYEQNNAGYWHEGDLMI